MLPSLLFATLHELVARAIPTQCEEVERQRGNEYMVKELNLAAL